MPRLPRDRAWALWLALTCACAAPAPPLERSARFPHAWYGTWSGPVQGYDPAGPRETFLMRYELGPGERPGRSRWTIVYEDGAQRQVRPYELVELDAAAGRYAIDEGDGLLLESRLLGDVLYTSFEIGGTRLLVREERGVDPTGAETLTVEFVTAPDTPERTTDTEPPAHSFPVRHVQRATLRRVPPAD